MSFLDALLGRRLATSEAGTERIKPTTGVATLGLDALGSSSYGPEAALTILIPLGMAGLSRIQAILWVITGLLLVLFVSYRQTIAAYPTGGGSYTVAKENLGMHAGLLAASSLLVDYILVVAVGISAGIGALESAFPLLQHHTLEACLIVLLIITLANLRGVRQSGLLWLLPTYLFVASLGLVLAVGLMKSLLSGGHPVAVEAPPPLPAATMVPTAWLLIRAFASGCTAMTGVEAVSNAVPIFQEPRVVHAQRTLFIICLLLGLFLLGIGHLSYVYKIGAMNQQQPGYQSVISQIAAATVGHGTLYYLCIAGTLAVLSLSANTSFSDFPRLCRLLAEDGYLPPSFANLGRRLVYSEGIVVLSFISAILLVIFDGITDRLIPLFAVGAFSAFTFSETGMMMYWKKSREKRARTAFFVNGLGALTTALALATILVTKFIEGAWITVLLIGGLGALFLIIGRHYHRLRRKIEMEGKLRVGWSSPPIVVVPIGGWDRVSNRALLFSMQIARDIIAVNISNDEPTAARLRAVWKEKVEQPAIDAGLQPPKLEIIHSPYRELFIPLLEFIREMKKRHPDRTIAVVIPELVHPRWWEYLLHNYSAAALKTLLLTEGGDGIVLISTPWYLREPLPRGDAGPPK